MEKTLGSDKISRTRENYWDNIKGFLIILVVFAHSIFDFDNQYLKYLVESIYYFHMPAFVFVSGFFSKRDSTQKKESIIKLAVVYAVMMFPFILYYIVVGIKLQFLTPYYSAWYVLALIGWRLLTPRVIKNFNDLAVLTVISLLVGYWQDISGVYVLGITKTVIFWPFFAAGFLIKGEQIHSFNTNKPYFRRILMAFGLIIIGTALAVMTKLKLGFDVYALMPGPYNDFSLKEPLLRASVFAVSTLAIICMLLVSYEKEIPILSKAGRNSLPIYAMHRVFTLLYCQNNSVRSLSMQFQLAGGIVLTILLVCLFGSNWLAAVFNEAVDGFSCVILQKSHRHSQCYRLASLFFAVTLLAAPLIQHYAAVSPLIFQDKRVKESTATKTSAAEDPLYRVMSSSESEKIDQALSILFAGDLILLEDQVKNAYDGEQYSFDECFEYTKQYISGADYAIGVFEGPVGGEEAGYSTSNYGDQKQLAISFPDEWASAIKNAGFDLVTTSNNHAFDKGLTGLQRTCSVLNEKQLDYTGTYLSSGDKEENSVKFVSVDGVNIAILSYTYGMNGITDEELITGQYSDNISAIVPQESEYLDVVMMQVQKDFKKAREADLIIVLPHWGEQFADKPDEFQLFWESVFKDLGADIILGDHTHSVQPVYIDTSAGQSTYTLYSPGNYANIYREYNGDCCALTEVYIDRQSKEIIGGSIIPMWINSTISGNYRPIPIYSILTDEQLTAQLTTYDLERVSEVQEHIAATMLSEKITVDFPQEKYFFDAEGFARMPTKQLVLTEDMRNGPAFAAFTSAENVCFIGDSVTEGTRNGGIDWYEPIRGLISGRVYNCGWGSSTIKSLISDHLEEIVGTDADLFVIAAGTNDVRYRNEELCAMTPVEYITEIKKLKTLILEHHPTARFMFIAPWISVDGDTVSKLRFQEKTILNEEYAEALEKYACDSGDIFIDPNGIIGDVLNKYPCSDYLLDAIHPNATDGVKLYSSAVLLYEK